MYDLITFGPSGIDTLVNVADANVHCSLNTKRCEVCLRYGDKIIAEDIVTKTAYNGMNNAVASARLNLATAFYTVIGRDHAGERILRALRRERVATRYVQTETTRSSNMSVVIDYRGERTILVHHGVDRRFRFPRALGRPRWMYLTSFGGEWQALYRSLARYLARFPSISLGFNPGSYQLKAGARALAPILKHTTVLFLNREEARLLTGIRSERNVRQLLDGMRKLGARIAVLTDGPNGSYASDGAHAWRLGIHPAPVVERTGCGDSYAAAFLAALANGHDVPEAMRWGTINSASVLQQVGPQDGLLTLRELERQLKRVRGLRPTQLRS